MQRHSSYIHLINFLYGICKILSFFSPQNQKCVSYMQNRLGSVTLQCENVVGLAFSNDISYGKATNVLLRI